MKLTTQEITNLVGGKLQCAPDIIITGAAGITEASPSDISFIANPKYTAQLASTQAGAVLVAETMTGLENRPVILVKNPHLAFATVLHAIAAEMPPLIEPGIHPSALVAAAAAIGKDVAIGPYVIIEKGAIIGDNTRILAHTYIGRNARIGAGCLLYPLVTIRENVSLGCNVIIHSGTVIGSDGFGFVPGRDGHLKVPQIGTVEIANDVEIGANAAIDRATTGKTIIGQGTKIDNLVHIAHNVHIGKHCFITAQVGFAGSGTLGNFVSIGGQCGIGGHLTVEDGVSIAARSGVIGDIAAGQMVSGYPARPHKEEMRMQALMHRLPELYTKIKKLLREDDSTAS